MLTLCTRGVSNTCTWWKKTKSASQAPSQHNFSHVKRWELVLPLLYFYWVFHLRKNAVLLITKVLMNCQKDNVAAILFLTFWKLSTQHNLCRISSSYTSGIQGYHPPIQNLSLPRYSYILHLISSPDLPYSAKAFFPHVKSWLLYKLIVYIQYPCIKLKVNSTTIQNESNLIDFVMRIEFTQAIWS